MGKILTFLMVFGVFFIENLFGANLGATQQTVASLQHKGKDNRVQIILKNKNGEFTAVLDDTKVARSFIAQLPLTLNLEDYASHEKVARLKTPLEISEAPSGADGKRGELSYFAPWKNFVIYYKHQPYYDGIVRLGELVGDTTDKVAVDGEITIELVKDIK